ncbi:MAG: ATP-binding protein, partial [Gammaproteobacteria bacterium]|nr:ATP-binding protein [Gammaproteobacteria bacterium]
LSYTVFDVVVRTNHARLETDFQLDVNRRLGKLEQGLTRAVERLRSVSAFYLSSETVEAQEFRDFTANYLHQEAGLSMFAWAPLEVIDDAAEDYSEDPLAGLALPLFHIEPGPQERLGFEEDLLAIPGMPDAVEAAFGRGDIQYLLADTTIILVAPTLDMVDWSGVAIAVLPIESIKAWIDLKDWNASISIIEEQNGRVILQSGHPGIADQAYISTLSLGGEIWRVTSMPLRAAAIRTGAWATLIAGIVMTGLMLLLIMTLANSTRRAERVVRQRTRELEQAEIEARGQALRLADEVAHSNQVIAAIPSILISVDLDRRINQWNRAIQHVSGIAYNDAAGKKLEECGWSGDMQALEQGVADCLAQKKATRLENLIFSCSDGSEATIGMAIVPVHDSENALDGCLLIGADITEKNMMEIQLREAQRLEAVGRLAAGIAHEVNTPAQFVSDNTTFLKDAFEDLIQLDSVYNEVVSNAPTLDVEQKKKVADAQQAADRDFLLEEIPQALEQSMDGIHRIADIVRAMKEFSHPGGGGHKEQVDLNRLITNAITVAANEWKYHAEVETDLDATLPPVPCYPRELNQVVLNLLINAAHSIADSKGDSGERGKIVITTTYDKHAVEMRLSDSGTGIPEHVRGKIFEPFFTTKEVGRGSGQGLALAYSAVVDQHEGSLSFETATGVGTTFIVSLPLQMQDATDEVTA